MSKDKCKPKDKLVDIDDVFNECKWNWQDLIVTLWRFIVDNSKSEVLQ